MPVCSVPFWAARTGFNGPSLDRDRLPNLRACLNEILHIVDVFGRAGLTGRLTDNPGPGGGASALHFRSSLLRLHDDKGSLLSRVPSFSPPESCTASRPNSMQVCFGPTSRIRSAHIAYPVHHHSIPTFHLPSTAYSIRIEE
jgi:hypothetical protein